MPVEMKLSTPRQPPALDEEIAAWEAFAGVAMPDDLRALFRITREPCFYLENSRKELAFLEPYDAKTEWEGYGFDKWLPRGIPLALDGNGCLAIYWIKDGAIRGVYAVECACLYEPYIGRIGASVTDLLATEREVEDYVRGEGRAEGLRYRRTVSEVSFEEREAAAQLRKAGEVRRRLEADMPATMVFQQKPPPATAEQIAGWEHAFGHAMPPDLRRLLTVSNGPVLWDRALDKELQILGAHEARAYYDAYAFAESLPDAIPICLDGWGVFAVYRVRNGEIDGVHAVAANDLFEDAVARVCDDVDALIALGRRLEGFIREED